MWSWWRKIAVHNVAGHEVEVEIDVGAATVEDLLEDRDHEVRDGRLRLRLDAYGHHWLRPARQ